MFECCPSELSAFIRFIRSICGKFFPRISPVFIVVCMCLCASVVKMAFAHLRSPRRARRMLRPCRTRFPFRLS